MSSNIMIDGCQNCHQDKSAHMPDGACLFEPTHYKAFPPSSLRYEDFPSDTAHVEQPKKKSWLRRLFT